MSDRRKDHLRLLCSNQGSEPISDETPESAEDRLRRLQRAMGVNSLDQRTLRTKGLGVIKWQKARGEIKMVPNQSDENPLRKLRGYVLGLFGTKPE